MLNKESNVYTRSRLWTREQGIVAGTAFRPTPYDESAFGIRLTARLQHVSGMAEYTNKSAEELRLQDYEVGQ
jgi:hypothetical protein